MRVIEITTESGGTHNFFVEIDFWTALSFFNHASTDLAGRKLHVFIRADDPQNDPHRNRESPPRRVTHDIRCGKLVVLSASLQFAPASREHVCDYRPLLLYATTDRSCGMT